MATTWGTSKKDECAFCRQQAVNIVKTAGGFVRVCDEHVHRVPAARVVSVARLHLKANAK